MKTYQKVLIAIDLEGGSKEVLSRAAQIIGDAFDAQVTVVNVGHYPMPTYAGVYGEGLYSAQEISVDFSAIRAQIVPQIEALIEEVGISGASSVVEFGRPADLILELAERDEVDLIIVGSHGKHGIALLLGSTATSVLHHARCDVLAVRIDK